MATVTQEQPAAAPRRPYGLRRDVRPLPLLFVSVGSIIGSGWLFGALTASQVAGPAALISWGIGAVFMIVLALVYAELAGAYPVSGGTARYPHYSHGSVVGYAAGWLWWLGAVTVAPIEVEAALQYFTHYVPWLTTPSGNTVVLTAQGYGIAVVLMAIFTVVNLLGVRRLASSNTAITAWKIAIPFVAVIALMATRFHGANFHAAGGFMPFGFHGVFAALPLGIIFAYQGFEQAAQLGGESANPRRALPIAVIGSILLGVVLYILLQVAFLGALAPANLSHGWSKLTFHGLIGPFAGLASGVGLGWLAILLYIDAAVSPGGTGLLYTGSSARVSYALGHNGYWPSIFNRLSARGIPIWSTLFSFVIGVILFLPFPGWQNFVNFITAAASLSYAMMPVALMSLRRQDPRRERPFVLPVAEVLAPFGFVVASLVAYWSGWATMWRILVALVIGLVFFVANRVFGDRSRQPQLDLRGAAWIPLYVAGLAALTFAGRYGGGRDWLPFWWDVAAVAVFALVVYFVALRVRLPPAEAKEYIEHLDPMDEDAAVA